MLLFLPDVADSPWAHYLPHDELNVFPMRVTVVRVRSSIPSSLERGIATVLMLLLLLLVSLQFLPRYLQQQTNKQTPWSESTSELYQPSDRRLPAKLVPTFADRGCHVVSVTEPYSCILGFLDRSRYVSFK
jgi:hypothetical protein